MADNKNIIIGILVLAIILLVFLVFRSMMYSPVNNQSNAANSPNSYQPGRMGPGMMNNPGNYGYGPRMMDNQTSQMRPEMMYNQNGSYGYGYGIMGNMMMGNMMALYYPESKPITQDMALKNMENFTRQYYGSKTEVEDFMAFSSNYYAIVKDATSGQDIAEILVDRYSGSTYPEPGPNMMWNTRYGVGRVPVENSGYDLAGAKKLAENFLTGYLPGAQIQESYSMPGYYTFDFGLNENEGMLSVNAYSGQIWVHNWHGFYLGEMNVTG